MGQVKGDIDQRIVCGKIRSAPDKLKEVMQGNGAQPNEGQDKKGMQHSLPLLGDEIDQGRRATIRPGFLTRKLHKCLRMFQINAFTGFALQPTKWLRQTIPFGAERTTDCKRQARVQTHKRAKTLKPNKF
jgi:hypothetical protein